MGSTIVGVTDSSTLGQLDEAFSAALFLSPAVPTSHTHHPKPEANAGQVAVEKAISKAMKSKAVASIVTFANISGSKAAASQGKKFQAYRELAEAAGPLRRSKQWWQ